MGLGHDAELRLDVTADLGHDVWTLLVAGNGGGNGGVVACGEVFASADDDGWTRWRGDGGGRVGMGVLF